MGGAGKGKEGKGMLGKGKGGVKGKGKMDVKGKGKGKSGTKGFGKGMWEPLKWVKVKPTVLVTGAAGFVAMSVIRRLVDKLYKVRGTVRSLEDEAKVGPLKKRFPTLELFEADLLGGPEAFEKAMAGCKYVIHCASPFQNKVEDPQKDLVEPAVKGTEAVMQAAVTAGISRVVLTSSAAAVGPPQDWMTDPSKADKEKIFSEEDWNTTSTVEDGAYRFSKVTAEKKAMEIVKDSSVSLAVICPSFVIGPMMSSRADGESMKFIKAMLDGTKKEQGCSGFPFGVVDVREVSLAHVTAMESDAAGGKRFLVTSETGFAHIAFAKMLQDRFKAYPVPTEGPEPVYIPKYNIDLAKEVLKFKPRPVEISLRDMANAAIRNGIVEKKVVLKPVVFGEVSEIQPDTKGANLIVKVVSLKDEEETKGGKKIQEVVVGDATAIVTLSLAGDEIGIATVGATLEVRNAVVRMPGGHIRLQVGKWGKITVHEGGKEVVPKMDKDMSEMEYELVAP